MTFLLPALALLAAAPATAAVSPIEGLWINHKKSVVVRIAPCGANWCGEVVKANAREEAKAARYGIDDLEGETLLTALRRVGATKWKGQVYVPKLRRKVGSTVTMTAHNQMSVSGCFAGIICRTQVWTKVG